MINLKSINPALNKAQSVFKNLIALVFCFFINGGISVSGMNTVNLSVSSSSGTEAGMTTITVTATASAVVSGDQTVDISITGSNITPSDYSLSGPTITIPSGTTFGSVTFTISNDAIMESLETAVLTISNPSAGIVVGTEPTAMIHIEDNDVINTATLYNRGYLENNSTITVQGKPYLNQGLVTGSGTIIGSFINSGTFSPGNN